MHFSGEDQCCGSEMPAEMRDEKIVAVRCQLKCGVGCHNNRQQSPLIYLGIWEHIQLTRLDGTLVKRG